MFLQLIIFLTVNSFLWVLAFNTKKKKKDYGKKKNNCLFLMCLLKKRECGSQSASVASAGFCVGEVLSLSCNAPHYQSSSFRACKFDFSCC